ncbi:MAG: hypothetical protein JWN25_1692 [Verrucomicrobiales bacterium]|nr:hypothetical protein [Verrucomicrobiales bacterium]
MLIENLHDLKQSMNLLMEFSAFRRFKIGTITLCLGFSTLFAFAESKVVPNEPSLKLIEKYCYECHGDGSDKGKVALDDLLKQSKVSNHAAEWEKAWTIVRHEFMPPAGQPTPTDAERKSINDWIAREMLSVDFKNPDPGRVTIRRLNRMEYDYTVQDLFGSVLAADQEYSSDSASASLKLRDRLPPDDTAFGFDNIGDFQTVSPALLEKFFDMAEFVVGKVVVLDGPKPPRQDLSILPVKSEKTPEQKQVSQVREFEIKQSGTFQLEMNFTVGGWQEYGGAYDFTAKIGEKEMISDMVEVGGYKHYKYSKSIELQSGKNALTLTTVARKPDSKGATNYLDLAPKITLAGPMGGKANEYPAAHRRIFFQGDAPVDPAKRQAYARAILERVASKAFRHPVDETTLDGLQKIALKNELFEKGIAQAISAILTSPKFLFRSETQPRPDDPKSIHPLDEYALASRLSYLLWLSLPDEELTRLAKEGALRKNLRAQVTRMLADPKSERFFEDFPGQWLRTRNVLMTSITRDALLNPVRASMKRETEMLFEYIARNDKDIIELITANYTFLDKKLADYYGIKGVEGNGFQKVMLSPESKRGGILTHGSFLVASSNPNRTSPVKRGTFVLENLLATAPPPPPPDIPALDDAKVGSVTPKTVREQLAVHRENKSCAACHAHFDPIGIVLENYDMVGIWRDKENGQAIETREKTVSGETLTGMDDLRNLFAARKERFYRGATEKLLTYALGRGLEPSDSVTIDQIAARMLSDSGKFSTLLIGVVESPAFQSRRGDSGILKQAPKIMIPPTPPPEKRDPQRRNRPLNAVNEITSEKTGQKPELQAKPQP